MTEGEKPWKLWLGAQFTSRVFYWHGSQLRNDDARSEKRQGWAFVLAARRQPFSSECDLRLALHESQQSLSKRGGFDITFLVCVLWCGWKCGGWESSHGSIARGHLLMDRGWKSLFWTAPHSIYSVVQGRCGHYWDTSVRDNRGAAWIRWGKHDSHPSLQTSMRGGSLTWFRPDPQDEGGFVHELLKASVMGGLKGWKRGRGVQNRIRKTKEGATQSVKQAVNCKAYEVLDRNIKRKFDNIFSD